MDSDDDVSLMEQESMGVVGDAESVIGYLPMIETHEATADDEIESQGKMLFGGIW